MPTGQNPSPSAQDCTALRSLTLGISFEQPRVFLGMCGQVRVAVFTESIMPAACSCVLQYRLYGVSTLAHSVSHEVGRPPSHALAALAQQAELTSDVQAVRTRFAAISQRWAQKTCRWPARTLEARVLVALVRGGLLELAHRRDRAD